MSTLEKDFQFIHTSTNSNVALEVDLRGVRKPEHGRYHQLTCAALRFHDDFLILDWAPKEYRISVSYAKLPYFHYRQFYLLGLKYF